MKVGKKRKEAEAKYGESRQIRFQTGCTPEIWRASRRQAKPRVLKINYSDRTAFFIGSAGIALGLLILGKKVMLTVGSKIVILDFYKGFTA